MSPILYLIDGHALAYRTYFALTGIGDASRWLTREGEPTAGTYGFTSVLFKILEQDHPEYLAVSFDTGRTFRDDLYPDYKGTRAKMPDDLRVQLDRIREVVLAFSLPILEADGYEADDVLGSVARKAATLGLHTLILTGDRDLLQLAAPHTTIRLAGNKLSEAQDYGPAEVEARYGVRPDQFVDYKALIGDSSDNIPGVAGVGEKTAASLLQQYSTLDEIYRHLDEVPGRFQKKLAEGKDNAYLSQRLSRIVTDLDFPFELPTARVGQYDRARVAELFRVLEFRSLLARLPQEEGRRKEEEGRRKEEEGRGKEEEQGEKTPPSRAPVQPSLFEEALPPRPPAPPLPRAVIVAEEAALKALCDVLRGASTVAFDVETTSTDPMACELVGIALAVGPGEGYYIPIGHHGESQLPLPQVLAALRGPLSDPSIAKVGHNAKYDYVVLARHGLEVAPITYDTMLAEWLCEPASRSLGLKNLAWRRLGVEMTEITELIGKGKKQITMAEVPAATAAPYAAADVDMTLRLIPLLTAELQQKNAEGLLHDLEMPLLPVLAQMEMNGICLDTGFLARMSATLEQRLAEIERAIYADVGYQFNINSTQQLSDVLFGTLGLSTQGVPRTRTGKYSTAAEVLDNLRGQPPIAAIGGQHPVLDRILEQRELSKLKSTYVDALPQAVNPVTGRVHTKYNQAGSVTGRIASEGPNLQNIPIRTEMGRQVRRAFAASPGWQLAAVDYSQVELRIVAHLAGDRGMLDAFRAGQDIHAATAAAVFGVPLAQVTQGQRRDAKAVNFGLIYGMSAFGLTRSTELTLAESENFVKAYFEKFPGVADYLERTKALAREQGYVETLFGRRRYFPVLQRPASTREDAIQRSRADREAINAPVQGTAADIMKRAMVEMAAALARSGLRARMLLQVHDELVFECPPEEAPALVALARQVMEGACKLDAPLKADARTGANWDEMAPL